jgi:hypothetical protein
MPTASPVPVTLSLSIRYSLYSITCRIQNYMLHIMFYLSFNTFQVLLDGELEQLGHLLLLLLAHFRLALAQPAQWQEVATCSGILPLYPRIVIKRDGLMRRLISFLFFQSNNCLWLRSPATMIHFW